MIYFNNYELSYVILKKLVKMGIRQNLFPFNGEFREDEIESIKSITLTSNDSLEELEQLKNLTSLCIVKGLPGNTNDVIDYNVISKLVNLETLTVINTSNILELDIGNLSKLKKLRLIDNASLEKINGLEKLKELEEVIICGNVVNSLDNPKEYIDNTINTQINILDVSMYNNAFSENKTIQDYLNKKIKRKQSFIKFGEMLKFDNECYVINNVEMQKMDDKASEILERLNLDGLDTIQKVYKIYEYIVNNTEYDYSGIEERNTVYNSGIDLAKKENEVFKKEALTINSSYCALINNRAVCDGYVNMMRLLLSMENIQTNKVMCLFKSDQSLKPDHVIIKFKDENGNWYYCDPEKEQKTKQIDYFALTYDEISKTHKLCEEEELIVKSNESRYKNVQRSI